MGMPTKYVVLHESTGSANTALTTPTLNTAGFDSVVAVYEPVGGAVAAGTISLRDPDLGAAINLVTVTCPLDTTVHSIAIGRGVGTAASGYYLLGMSSPLPSALVCAVGALGAGISCHLKVYGRRNHRGPDVTINAD